MREIQFKKFRISRFYRWLQFIEQVADWKHIFFKYSILHMLFSFTFFISIKILCISNKHEYIWQCFWNFSFLCYSIRYYIFVWKIKKWTMKDDERIFILRETRVLNKCLFNTTVKYTKKKYWLGNWFSLFLGLLANQCCFTCPKKTIWQLFADFVFTAVA